MKVEKVADYSTNRCQATMATKQCDKERVEGSQFCVLHGGAHELASKNRQELKNLRLMKWKTQIAEQANSANIFSLRDEVGVLRVVLQETLEKCDSPAILMTHANTIATLVNDINRTITSCLTIESALGAYLTEEQLAALAESIIKVITDSIQDPDLRNSVSEQILTLCTAQ